MLTRKEGVRSDIFTNRQAAEKADEVLQQAPDRKQLRFLLARSDDDTAELGSQLSSLIGDVLAALARGETVTVAAMPEEISTVVAAHELGVSRPTLMKFIANGELSARKVGTHFRLKTSDVRAFRAHVRNQERDAFAEMRALEDELDSE